MSTNGVLMGLLTSLVGLPMHLELGVWVLSYILWGIAVFRFDLARFWAPLIASALSGVWVGTLQFVLRDAYVANNPWYADQIAESGGITAGSVLGFGVGMGVLWGLIVGAALLGVDRLRRRGSVA